MNKKHRSLEELKSDINIEYFIDYRLNHTRSDTEKNFNISPVEFKTLADEFDLFNVKRESKRNIIDSISKDKLIELCLRYSMREIAEMYGVKEFQILALKNKYDLTYKSKSDLLINIISKEELSEYYSCHTLTDTMKHFDTNYDQINQLLDNYSIERHSVESDYDQRRKTFLSKFGKSENPGGYEQVRSKFKATLKNKYGEDNPSRIRQFKDKAIETFQRYRDDNKLHQSSKIEKLLLDEFIKLFGESRIKYQHFDIDRYPFNCDFYFPDTDIWIELNGWWHHGEHPYTASDQDQQTLIDAEIKYPNQYESFRKVWTQSDPIKHDYALKNNLKYYCIYNDGSIYNSNKQCIYKLKSIYRDKDVCDFIIKLNSNKGGIDESI